MFSQVMCARCIPSMPRAFHGLHTYGLAPLCGVWHRLQIVKIPQCYPPCSSLLVILIVSGYRSYCKCESVIRQVNIHGVFLTKSQLFMAKSDLCWSNFPPCGAPRSWFTTSLAAVYGDEIPEKIILQILYRWLNIILFICHNAGTHQLLVLAA